MTLKRILTPDWVLPPGISAAVTTRTVGNLAAHVGDDPAAVILRREQLRRELNLPFHVRWLQQQHTTQVGGVRDSHFFFRSLTPQDLAVFLSI